MLVREDRVMVLGVGVAMWPTYGSGGYVRGGAWAFFMKMVLGP
jgi:hypothetical protein